jgi:hypothetical protein
MTTTEPGRRFPVMLGHLRRERRELERLGCPQSVPWDLVAPHEARAWKNHWQTLERLAERGGLSPHELVAVLRDERLFGSILQVPLSEIVAELLERVQAFETSTPTGDPDRASTE